MASTSPLRARIDSIRAVTPSWLRVALGVAVIAFGVVILTRPLSSLSALALLFGAGMIVLGLLDALHSSESANEVPHRAAGRNARGFRMLAGIVSVLAGIAVLALPGLSLRLLVVFTSIALLVSAAGGIAGAIMPGRTPDARLADAALGVASAVFGVLALLWVDATLVVLSVVFGVRVIAAGMLVATRALAPSRPAPIAPSTRPAKRSRFMHTIGAVSALALAIGAGTISANLREATPVIDSFYAAPEAIPDMAGALLRAEPFTRDVPENARGWRILYTTSAHGRSALASAIVIVPRSGAGDWPVISWAHGTTGFARHCAPSLARQPFESGALFVLPEIIDRGWALVATDYIGLGAEGTHPYLIGEPSGRAVLDAAAAARQLHDADLGDSTVVWGHSQGGGAALWAGALAADEDIPLAGVAALAPASDPLALVTRTQSILGGSVFASYAVAAYTAEYPDVTAREYIRPGADGIMRAMSQRCLAEPGALVSVLSALSLARDPDIFATDPTRGPLGTRLTENAAPAQSVTPVLIAQGTADQIIDPDLQHEYVQRMCAAGEQITERVLPGLGHLQLVAANSPLMPELFSWTAARFTGDATGMPCS